MNKKAEITVRGVNIGHRTPNTYYAVIYFRSGFLRDRMLIVYARSTEAEALRVAEKFCKDYGIEHEYKGLV